MTAVLTFCDKSSSRVADWHYVYINRTTFYCYYMFTFSDRVTAFNRSLQLPVKLPADVSVMNPFEESPLALRLSKAFYDKYYSDNKQRHIILGINPGRFGAALSGVPFTDFKRLERYCGISAEGHTTHEPSSEFVYLMITSIGSVADFYARFYINSVCPLGFVIRKEQGGSVNYNYYDDQALYTAVKPFIIRSIRQQIDLGIYTNECFCMGVKNGKYLIELNEAHHFFEKITVLPHPRFIMQYKRKELGAAIDQYHLTLHAAYQ